MALCEARSLAVQGVRNGETGVVNVGVAITNRGTRACSLPDQPSGVELVRAGGQILNVRIAPPPSPASARIALPPGVQDTATLTSYWMNWCQAPPGSLEVRITFAAIQGVISGPLTGSLLPRCDAPKQPSTIQIDGVTGGGG